MKKLQILVIIPARGGSKGIPRKNLRILNHHPLIYYSIKTALRSKFSPDVYVSSEDDEILQLSKKFGAQVYRRPQSLADDVSTLDPVIYDAYENISQQTGKTYQLIITIQPTSPLLQSRSLDTAIGQMLQQPELDTILSAKNATHLSWRKENDKFLPNFTKRVNRQYLTPTYTETGGFLITRNTIISKHNRIGKNTSLHILNNAEAIDIDTFEDWNLCEYYLQRKHILFVVSGYPEIGLGHVYNVLSIADEILNHHLMFLVDDKSQLAFDKIAENNHAVYIQKHENILDDITELQPDVVINDRLDTELEYVDALKNRRYQVINFEDLGGGTSKADLVINAMYPEKQIMPNHYFGISYFCIRNEFIYSPIPPLNAQVDKVLLSFGGVDPNNYTYKVLKTIYPYCQKNGIAIKVIAGMGYEKLDGISGFEGIELLRNVPNMSDHLSEADIVFTSAGRTTFEVACLGIPAVVLAQNERETTHFFATQQYGFINLGLGYQVPDEEILTVFERLVSNFEMRAYARKLMLKQDVKGGKKRVIKLINELINRS